MLTQSQVFEMVRKEATYAARWASKGHAVPPFDSFLDSDVHARGLLKGMPFSYMDWMVIAKKYWDEIFLAFAGYAPDSGVLRIRMIKVISILVRAMQVHGEAADLERLAGVSSSQFPIIGGGLASFEALTDAQGCFVPRPETKSLRADPGGECESK